MKQATLDKLLRAMQGSKGVPATERSVASVLGALDSSEAGKQAVVRHIIEDFALTQKVLKLANSSMYAPFGEGSASVSSALDVLGSEALLHLVLGAELVSDEQVAADDHLSRTLLASELARGACATRAEDASVATLMFEVGRLMTARYLPQETAAIARRLAQGEDAHGASEAVLGLSYQALGLELATRWNLPQSIRATLDGSGDPLLVGVARFASTASALVQAGQGAAAQTLLEGLALPGIDKGALGQLLQRKTDEAAARQAQRPPPSAEDRLHELLRSLQQEPRPTVDALAQAMLAPMAAMLQTAHCLLFMLTRSGEQRVRMGVGKGIDELRSRLKIAAEFSPTAFHAAIKNHSDVSIADVSKLKDASLPEGYRALLPQVSRFIILPIGHSRVSGLLYCDWDNDRTLTNTEIEALKQLRNLYLPLFPQ